MTRDKHHDKQPVGRGWSRRQFLSSLATTGAGLTLGRHLLALDQQAPAVDFQASRQELASDPYRPLYHFSTPEGLLNDPNGMCQWRGTYHLFYQLYPAGANAVRWGHAYSDDLLHWKDLPPAISPTIEQSCFSGNTLVEDDRVIAMYHGTRVGNMIATASDPMLMDWKKHPDNPVIPLVKTNVDGEPYRVFDPEIWKEKDGYYSLSGTYQNGARGRDAELVEHLFHSKNLADWEHLGTLIEGSEWTEPGEDGAVPNFLPIGNGKHMLMFFSHKRAGQYLVGDYDRSTHKFKPDYHGRLSFGTYLHGTLHAPSAFIDDTGRFLAIFNMRENMTTVEEVIRKHKPRAWYGIMSLPRHYWLDGQNRLRAKPAPRFDKLRFEHEHADTQQIAAGEEIVLERAGGKAIELDVLFQPGQARSFGVRVLRSPDGREYTTVRVDTASQDDGQGRVGIDVSHASLHDLPECAPAMAPFTLTDNKPVRLRIFVDRSIVEVFADDTQCVSLRTYPKRMDSNGVNVFAEGGSASLLSCDVWQMRSVWPELKHLEGR